MVICLKMFYNWTELTNQGGGGFFSLEDETFSGSVYLSVQPHDPPLSFVSVCTVSLT